jgi:putative endopeptidase
MDEPTRQAALNKASKMIQNNKIGYPSPWRDYTGIQTTKNSFFENVMAAGHFEKARSLAEIGRPADRTKWFLSAPTADAYSAPQNNEIVFPAGILQPPMFDAKAPDAVNFGSMGLVMGHEITHGFDDQGRQFDAEGNMRDWWSPTVNDEYVRKTDCLKKQYSTYAGVDGLNVNGALTLGENIADQGGLKAAYRAMLEWSSHKPASETQYRFSNEQQFFLGFAQAWCFKVRPETARVNLTTDPHAPPYWRVNGTVSNLNEFRAAFQCREGAPMVRAGPQQCAVW